VRAAALKLLDCARQNQLGDDFHPVFEKAQPLAPKHADLELAYALGLLKHNLTSNSLRVFDYSVAKDPDALLAYHALAWQYFMKGDRQKGINNLADLVRKIPRPRGDRELGAYEAHVIEFAGKLRQFALKAAESSTGAVLSLDDVKVLDQAVLEHCEAAKQRYAAGIEAVSRAMDALDQAAKAASNPESEANWKRDRNRLTYYAKFDFDVAEAFLRELLKK
jgi:tetratricopeptide (TPR) repeat protein